MTAKSDHVSDPFLKDFLNPSFDAAEYLNSTLPSLQVSSVSGVPRATSQSLPLVDLSIEVQTLVSQLNAHTTRLTSTLTQLTDEILRSGGRLAYEVELLRGEALSLAETLTEGLKDDVVKFVPAGIQVELAPKPGTVHDASKVEKASSAAAPPEPSEQPVQESVDPEEPAYISRLRTLTLVRQRLESVIKTFGDAMEFTFPPSELSVSSSFLSVSAPESGAESHSTEERGQQVLQKLRDEVNQLLNGSSDPIEGIEKAAQRIEELKELNKVWRGTAEERGRSKFIDSLAKLVEDRHRELLRELEQSAKREGKGDDSAKRSAAQADGSSESRGAYSIISQLQKIRSGL